VNNKVLLILSLVLMLVSGVMAAGDEVLELSVGEAKVVAVHSPKKVAVGDPAVADVQILSDKEILLNAKAEGSTTLIVWEADGNKSVTKVVVEQGALEKTMVEIDVQVLEINRNAVLDLGIDWDSVLRGKETSSGLSPATPLHVAEEVPPPLLNWGSFNRGNLDVMLNALESKGFAKVLAKPKLLAVSGTQASFLSGGEVPIVNQDSQGKTSVTWKQFGVTLDIQPTADPQGNVSADVRAEVSNLDAVNAVRLPNGTFMPALRTRWAKTQVFVKKGGTLIMAGLIQDQQTESSDGVPFLSDLPLFGEIFKTHHNETIQTELVIFVTPTIVGQKAE